MSKKQWFTVDADGFAELQRGREPWKLVKELVANAWDEDITACDLEITSVGNNRVRLVCTDDSSGGFTDIEDARTFFRRTDKRKNPVVRGRFNLGEKEIISVALWAKVVTMSGAREFCADGTVRRLREKTAKGSRIELLLPWSKKTVEEVAAKLGTFLPPAGKALRVNGTAVPPLAPAWSIATRLETVLESEDGLRPTTRATTVHVHRATGRGYVYEMGVPVIELADCPYLVDVQQKVPLSPNRDALKPAYMADLMAEVLNVVAAEVPAEDISATWIRTASEDDRVAPAALKQVKEKRWGKKVALWSSDPLANEKALDEGYTVVHGRTLSPQERGQFTDKVGLQSTAKEFPTNYANVAPIARAKWTKAMRIIAGLYEAVATKLIGAAHPTPIRVSWVTSRECSYRAWYAPGNITLNKAHLKGWDKAAALAPEHMELLIHEIGHHYWVGDTPHDAKYRQAVERLAGAAVMLALGSPALFRWAER